MSYILGSFIPNPVTADIVGFMADDDVRSFNLLSPSANSLVKYYILMKNDFYYIGIGIKDEKLGFELRSLSGGCSSFTIDFNNDNHSKVIISSMFAKIRTVRRIYWRDIKIDDSYIQLFLKADPKSLQLSDTAIEVSRELFMKFLHKFPQAVQIKEVEISNRLLSKENILLLSDIGVHRSWKAQYQNFESRVIDVTDDTLEEIKRLFQHKALPTLNLKGFLSGLSVNGIDSYSRNPSRRNDFGILGYDQLTAALDFLSHDEYLFTEDFRLHSWNGLKTLSIMAKYERGMYSVHDDSIIYPSLRFAISINENVTGPLSENCLPVEGIPSEGLRIFDNMVKALNSGDEVEWETDKYEIGSVQFSFENLQNLENKLKITVSDEKFGNACVELVRAGITLSEAHHLVVKLLKMCRSIRSIEWYGFVLNQELYDLLKQISDDIDVSNYWTIAIRDLDEFTLPLLRETNGLLGKFYLSENYVSKVELSNEMLAAFLGKKYHIDWNLLLNEDESGKLSTPLTDKFLQLLVTNVKDYLRSFDFKMYTSLFTADGIKLFVKALESRCKYSPPKYHVGRVHSTNVADVEKMILEYEAADSSQWSVRKEEKDDVCSVTIEKIKNTGTRTLFAVSLDIIVAKP